MSSPSKKIRIAVTMGDAAGIGPEVVLKALGDPAVRRRCRPVLIGSHRVFQRQVSKLGVKTPLRRCLSVDEIDWTGEGINVLEPEKFPSGLPRPGKIDPAWSRAAMDCVASAVKLTIQGTTAALVTAPINKEGIHRAGFRYQGHTDFLAHLTRSPEAAMMLVGGKIRVVLATVHIPISRVSRSLSRKGIASKIRLAFQVLVRMGFPSPRIAVAGLNPHAGEAGAFGKEEIEIIAPAVADCRREGIKVEGPLPPDTVFYRHYRGEFDAVVAMYHDQGLIPLKTLAFERGVNVTLGLPLVRTSPDHGTAYELAGKGRANPRSMIEAIKLASRLVRR